MVKQKKRLFFAAGICIFAVAFIVSAQAQDRSKPIPEPIRGFTIAAYSKTGYLREAETIKQVLEIYRNAGVHINVLVTFSINQSGDIEEGILTPDRTGVKRLFEQIRTSGNIPCLSLYFDPADKSWRGSSNNVDIRSAGPAVSSYFDSINEDLRPALVNISPEMVNSEYSVYWQELITELHRIFPKAAIGYSTHYTSPVLRDGYPIPGFFGQLDYIGINLIAGAHSNIVYEQTLLNHIIIAAGHNLASRIEQETGKKVGLLFTEYGFPSHGEAASSPYDFNRGTAEEQLQHQLFASTLPLLKNRNFFLWSFSIDDFRTTERHYFWYKPRFDSMVPKKAAVLINQMLIDGVFPSPDGNVRSISVLKHNGEPEFIKKGNNKWFLSRPLFIYRDYTNSFSPNPLAFYYYRLERSEAHFSLIQQNIPIDGTGLSITIKGYSFATAAEKYESGKIKLIIDPHNEEEKDNTVFRRTIEIPFNTFSSISAGRWNISNFSKTDINIEVFPSDFATVIYSIEIESE